MLPTDLESTAMMATISHADIAGVDTAGSSRPPVRWPSIAETLAELMLQNQALTQELRHSKEVRFR